MTVHASISSSPLPQTPNWVPMVTEQLRPHYPPVYCELNYETPLQLLIAVILLPQNTADQVNRMTPRMFAAYSDTAAYMQANRIDLERAIYPLGFYRQKAKYVQETCRILGEKFAGQIPSNGYDLTQLPGVGRKGANVLMSELFGAPLGIAVDTHVHRVANRLHLSDGRNAIKVENDLVAAVPPSTWREIGYLLNQHGRALCHTHQPACATCPLQQHCPSAEL